MYAQVILFGDSLTQRSFSVSDRGWGAQLGELFQRRADVLNRGLSGYNTEWARLILPHIVTPEVKPDVVVIFFGANDSALAELNPHQHVAVDMYRANLDAMCDYLYSIGLTNSSLILVTPPPVDEKKWAESNKEEGGTLPKPDRHNAVTRLYAEAVEELGRERGISTVRLYTELNNKEDIGKYLSDGLHLSAEGNDVVASLMISVLEEKLSAAKTVFPDWKNVNPLALHQTLGLLSK